MKYEHGDHVQILNGKDHGTIVAIVPTTGSPAMNPTWLRYRIQATRDANLDPVLEAEPVYIVIWSDGFRVSTDPFYESELTKL